VTGLLVLGVGSNVSQGIQKALAASPRDWRVVAGCIFPHSVGLQWADTAYVTPPAADPAFVPWVAETCEREGIVAVLSGVEEVLEALAGTDVPAIVATPEVLAIANDKLATADWLRSHGFPAPATVRADGDVDSIGLPAVVKPVRGRGARGMAVVRDAAALDLYRGNAEYVVQEHLGDADHEYSVGAVCDRDGVLRGIMTVRRELLHGTTMLAEAGAYPEITDAAAAIVSALEPVGPCNVQLRLRDGEPVAFDINARFSGTTPMRVHLGFDEVDAVVAHLALGEPMPELVAPTSGLMVRYWNEEYPDTSRVRPWTG
jgi:carbamoyl-phosphate synthase large subunit